MTLILSLVRHGQSEDNPRGIWAGWRDAPLSKLGLRQAAAVSRSTTLATPPITAIYASPLARALTTGKAIHSVHPTVPFQINPLLREQGFGDAEGSTWYEALPDNVPSLDDAMLQGIYVKIFTREEHFPNGESLNMVSARAREAFRVCVLPHLLSGEPGQHVVIAAHGMFITEMVAMLQKLDPDNMDTRRYAGLKNTGWTRVEIDLKSDDASGLGEAEVPPLTTRVTHFNQHEHLGEVKPEPGEKETTGPVSQEAIKFFSGGE
ncbi:histidine phosphatase superfamily [Schizophyllum amplum]|uniref:Histidine phosphatase superfamily n=1 Tax=Schizophyllum amplum TaxID=97359 RepID=A0A550CBJ8_9AGAR|nr:histidine phosphatase superfamily [Auriculariopsis ampla]